MSSALRGAVGPPFSCEMSSENSSEQPRRSSKQLKTSVQEGILGSGDHGAAGAGQVLGPGASVLELEDVKIGDFWMNIIDFPT